MTERLTAASTIGAWLNHPVGGPLVRGHLAQAGVDERILAPFQMLSLEAAAAMSGGRISTEMIDGLVADANNVADS